ncbi:MAG: UDP-glucose 4-epimerase GalE [Alphaproteobacteria bacterium]
MKILVTGGAGYIGSHAAKALAARGMTPVVYDNLSRGHRWAAKWGPLEEGDVLDGARLDAVLARHRPHAVMHFAALSLVEESVRDPGLYRRNNVEGTASLLDAMARARVGIMVFSSTCATYGIPEAVPIDEAAAQRPINPYGEGKLAIEAALRARGAAGGLAWTALRYFNAAGADPAGEIGEAHEPETHAIPSAIAAALGRAPAFNLYGTDYPTPDGTAIRDYIHVSDLAEAHIAALEYLLAGGASDAFNLGTGSGVSVRQVIAAVEAAAGCRLPVREAPRRAGDPAILVADPAKAARVLGWRARMSDIGTLVKTAFDWHARHGSGG